MDGVPEPGVTVHVHDGLQVGEVVVLDASKIEIRHTVAELYHFVSQLTPVRVLDRSLQRQEVHSAHWHNYLVLPPVHTSP